MTTATTPKKIDRVVVWHYEGSGFNVSWWLEGETFEFVVDRKTGIENMARLTRYMSRLVDDGALAPEATIECRSGWDGREMPMPDEVTAAMWRS